VYETTNPKIVNLKVSKKGTFSCKIVSYSYTKSVQEKQREKDILSLPPITMNTLYELTQSTIEQMKERLKENNGSEEIGDIIHEVADGNVPLYTADLLEIAASSLDMATLEPEL